MNATPITCGNCGNESMYERVIQHTATMTHCGSQYKVTALVPAEVCDECKEVMFDYRAGKLLRAQLRDELGVMQPDVIKALRLRAGLKQKDVAKLTGFPESTISRWEKGHLIQTVPHDKFLRVLFDYESSVYKSRPMLGTTTHEGSFTPASQNVHWHASGRHSQYPPTEEYAQCNPQYSLAA